MTKRFLRLIFCCITLFSGESSLFSQSYVSTPKPVKINDNCGGYYEFLPVSYNDPNNSTLKYPLIIDISGNGGQGNGSIEDLEKIIHFNSPYYIYNGEFPDTVFYKEKPFSFLVLAPQFASRGSGEDVKDVIDFFLSQYRVDTTRIYLTGFSNGGEPTWAYPCISLETSSKIAALVPVAGVNTNTNFTGVQNIVNAKLPVWALHSIEDEIVPYSNSVNFVNAINSYNPTVPAVLTQLTGTHDKSDTVVYNPGTKFNISAQQLNIYEWMLQYSRQSNVLPLKLVTFNGKPIGNGNIQLNWVTEQEYDNDFFTLEKSGNAFSFVEIARVEGKNNQIGSNTYSYVDDKPYEGTSHYRLSQTDVDGKRTFFPVISVKKTSAEASVKVYPTLVKNELLKIEFGDVRSLIKTIKIIDMNGRVLYKQTGRFQNITTIPYYILNTGLNIVDISCVDDPALNKRVKVVKLN